MFAYHTDNEGVYAKPGQSDPWRLKGWAVTDANGQFQFDTIRPAPYPNAQIPAHIHVTLITTCCGRQFSDLMFDGDPLATRAYRDRFARANEHGEYAEVRKRADGSQEAAYTIRLRPRGEF